MALSFGRVVGALRRRAKLLGVSLRYKPGKLPVNHNLVLFESFQGDVIADSPLDIYKTLRAKHPEFEFVWSVKARSQTIEGARSVIWGSAEWLHALATAKYLVNNANFPYFFKKATGQVYLQTWHGTPLKRLGRDIPGVVATVGYQATMEREAGQWDYLIAPNQFFAEVFPPAFNHHGKVLLSGYPRNDRLVKTSSAERKAIRSQLGVSDGEKLVMYAPTWRDYEVTAGGEWNAVNYLDAGLRLPDGYRLMFRGHHNTLGAHDSKVAGGAIDATDYPDIVDLCIAADVLITDYSSVMFDYTVTGKPVLFFAPDLERYRSERGFYLDYEAEVPGPILRTSEEVVHALADLDSVVAAHSARYQAWRDKYDSLEDGSAAARVVSEVWG